MPRPPSPASSCCGSWRWDARAIRAGPPPPPFQRTLSHPDRPGRVTVLVHPGKIWLRSGPGRADRRRRGVLMRLRRVTAASPEGSHSAEHRPTVGVERQGRLGPLGSAVRQWLEGGGGPSRELLSAADDMLLFLGGGPALRAEAGRVLDAVGD